MVTVTFRCPPEWAAILPPPVAASQALPDWVRAMPASGDAGPLGGPVRTVKQCPPFLDAMRAGWVMRLAADVTVRDGAFSWDWDLPASALDSAPRSPLGLHVSAQAAGAPLGRPGQLFIKFMNYFAVETPPGWSALFTHPLNRADLPFHTLSGVVDCDGYGHGLVHFPAVWTDPGFEGVLPAGLPVAQLFVVPRGVEAALGVLEGPHAEAFRATQAALREDGAAYRRRYRAKGRG